MSRPTMRKPLAINRRPIASGSSSTPTSSSITAPLRRPLPGGRVGTNAKGTEEGYLYVAGVRDTSKRVTEFRTETDTCPVCHTDRQFNKNLRLLVSPCYHKMCESCIDRLFTLGPEPCPQCGRILRKVNFAHQTFEDLKVEKEVAVRRRMAEFFNKRREDFGSDREHDDYLEEVEDLTFNLLNDIDLPKTEARIAAFQKQNAEVIAANQAKAALESLSQLERDDLERRAREERMRMVEEAERIDRDEDDRARAAIVEALARGNELLATTIRHTADAEKAARADRLAKAVPPSLSNLTNPDTSNDITDPLDPGYHGPFVPLPYYDPDKAVWKKWYTMKGDYVDGRPGVIAFKEDKEGKFKPGGFDLGLFWEMEVRSAVEGLAA